MAFDMETLLFRAEVRQTQPHRVAPSLTDLIEVDHPQQILIDRIRCCIEQILEPLKDRCGVPIRTEHDGSPRKAHQSTGLQIVVEGPPFSLAPHTVPPKLIPYPARCPQTEKPENSGATGSPGLAGYLHIFHDSGREAI